MPELTEQDKQVAEAIRKKAIEMYESGYGCAEAILAAVSGPIDEETEVIPRIGTAFSSGIARRGHICGALIGALIASGLLLGRDLPSEPRELTYGAADKIMDHFEGKYKMLDCSALRGTIGITDPDEKKALEQAARESLCIPMVGDVAKHTFEVLQSTDW